MKNTNNLIATVVIILLSISLFIVYESSRKTTFNEAVLKNLNVEQISSLQIIRSNNENEYEISITERSGIKEIVDCLSQLKLKESRISNIEYTDSYWITIRDDSQGRRFGITLYDNTYISIYNYTEKQSNSTSSYKITNEEELDLAAIQSLINNR